MKHDSYCLIAGVRISCADINEVVHIILDALEKNQGLSIHLCNAYSLALALRDERVKNVLSDSDLNIADGWSVAFLGRSIGLTTNIRGSQLFRSVISHSQKKSIIHFFIGSDENGMNRIKKKISDEYPLTTIGGAFSGIFDSSLTQITECVRLIRASHSNLVWIGVGTPKQDLLVAQLRKQLPDVVFIPIGAVFDFLSGVSKEAPIILQRLKLEWFFRFIQEPIRLWKRYFLYSLPFVITEYIRLHTKQVTK